MITSIEIQNFQSHKKTKLNFHPGVNIIVGTSDSGKSAILRAINLAVTNRPSGNSFCSTWMDKKDTSKIEIIVDGETLISRQEKPYKAYILKIPGKTELELKAFGVTVPDEIEEAFNMTEVNLQKQLDSPFLLSKTPGEVASHFNKIAKLDKIDTATSNVNSWITQLHSRIGNPAIKDHPATGMIKQKDEYEKGLALFSHLSKFEIDVEVLEGMENKSEGMKTRETRFLNLINSISSNQRAIDEYRHLLDLEKPVNDLLGIINERNAKEVKRRELYRTIVEIREVFSVVEKNQIIGKIAPLLTRVLADIERKKKLKETRQVLVYLVSDYYDANSKVKEKECLISCDSQIQKVIALINDKNILINQRKALNSAVTSIIDTNALLKDQQAVYTSLHARFHANMPNICLLCGQKIKK